MTQPEVWTVGKLLTWTTDYLKQHAVEQPRLEAEVLLAHARRCRRIDLYAAYNDVADDATRATFRELVTRRAQGMPVAYLVGYREFYSLPFRVTPDVLIPRPETEQLVLALLDRIKQFAGPAPARVADVGTGSGIIAICAAKHARCQVVALDISPAALEVARANATEHKVADRVEFVVSDVLEGLPAATSFDFIVSNPPYITTAEMEQLPVEIRAHEPHQALAGGEQGIDVIGRLIAQAGTRLVGGGWLLMEISPMIKPQVLEQLAADGRFEPAEVLNDLAGLARVVQVRRMTEGR